MFAFEFVIAVLKFVSKSSDNCFLAVTFLLVVSVILKRDDLVLKNTMYSKKMMAKDATMSCFLLYSFSCKRSTCKKRDWTCCCCKCLNSWIALKLSIR